MKNIITSTLAFIIIFIWAIAYLPVFILYTLRAYNRYITRLYTNMLLMMSARRMIQDLIAEERA